MSNIKVPFLLETGEMLRYVDYYPVYIHKDTKEIISVYDWNFNKNKDENYIKSDSFILKDNYVFEEKLSYLDYGRGRSAAFFIFYGVLTKMNYYMFMSDMDFLLKNASIANGVIEERLYTFVKKGANYGIKLWAI